MRASMCICIHLDPLRCVSSSDELGPVPSLAPVQLGSFACTRNGAFSSAEAESSSDSAHSLSFSFKHSVEICLDSVSLLYSSARLTRLPSLLRMTVKISRKKSHAWRRSPLRLMRHSPFRLIQYSGSSSRSPLFNL
jgi:hypothetical protein